MRSESLTPDVVSAATKASPPIAVSISAASGLTLQEWVFVATFVYTILLIAQLLFKFFRNLNKDKGDG